MYERLIKYNMRIYYFNYIYIEAHTAYILQTGTQTLIIKKQINKRDRLSIIIYIYTHQFP